jgi:hypothetical protein
VISRCRQKPDPGPDFGAVGDVRVISAVFNHHGLPPGVNAFVAVNRDGEAAAHGQGYLDPIRAGPAQEFIQRGLSRSRSRRTGGKPLTQFFLGTGRLDQFIVLKELRILGYFFQALYILLRFGKQWDQAQSLPSVPCPPNARKRVGREI